MEDQDAAKQTVQAQQAQLSTKRDRMWDECGIEEKVERLRQALMGQRWALRAAQQSASQFENHQHDAKGEIVVPLRARGGMGEASSRDMLA